MKETERLLIYQFWDTSKMTTRGCVIGGWPRFIQPITLWINESYGFACRWVHLWMASLFVLDLNSSVIFHALLSNAYTQNCEVLVWRRRKHVQLPWRTCQRVWGFQSCSLIGPIWECNIHTSDSKSTGQLLSISLMLIRECDVLLSVIQFDEIINYYDNTLLASARGLP